jgi:hypothetical protein
MMNDKIPPRIDRWYLDADDDRIFTVIAFDAEEELIEIQYFDGGLDELNIEEWEEMNLEEVEQPEDWTGSMDEMEQDDLGYDKF